MHKGGDRGVKAGDNMVRRGYGKTKGRKSPRVVQVGQGFVHEI
jgi:hypothetical protein